jgi:HAD superfamily hydrolase (TIGR01490 family)
MIARTTNAPRIAAFFDIDGTLLGAPSLERRFFAALRTQHAIPSRNYLLWLAHSLRLVPRGIQTILYANKMYLRGLDAPGSTDTLVRAGSSQGQAAASVHLTCLTSLAFFPAALDQAAWHASTHHAIILVSGTLAPLAHQVALALTVHLATRNLPAQIGVCATRLEKIDSCYTGRIAGEAMFGQAKAQAIHQIAAERNFDLRRCYAYGDTNKDRWMLGAVGRPAAVNPSRELERVARLNDWPVLRWKLSSLAQPATKEAPGTSHSFGRLRIG